MGTAACYKFCAGHHFLYPLPQWLSDKWFVSLCSTLCHAALSGLFHASADLKLLRAPRGLFNHQIWGSTVLQEIQAGVTWRPPWRRQVCANARSNSEELKLANRDLLWERCAGSRASTGRMRFPPEAVSNHQQNMQRFSQS